MGELHLPRLRGAVGFIADASWREYGIEAVSYTHLMQTIRFASTVGGWKQHATLLFAVLIFCDRKHSTAGQ